MSSDLFRLKCRVKRYSLLGCRYGLLLLVFSIAGCGSGPLSSGRVPIHGTVTVNGASVSNGSLSLVPVDSGPASGATITNGEFEVDESSGPALGDYSVRLTGDLQKNFDPLADESTPPPTYTTLTVTIVEENQKLELDFLPQP